jgi:hypothetical protein
MKTISNFLTISLLTVACCASLGFSGARADDDSDEQGGDIEGTETLDVEIVMTPTAAASAGSSIELSLEAEDDEGTTQATLKLEPQGLAAGTYNVSVTLKSDGSTVALGSFTVSGGEDEDDQGDDDNQGDENDQGDNEVEFGSTEGAIPFPANFNPLDIATVSVADATGVVLFTADLTNVSSAASMNLNANVQAIAGPGNPGAAGNAVLTAFKTRGGPKGSLQVNGRGLPPSTPLIVAVNGTTAKKVSSDKTGNMSVLLKPKRKTGTVAAGVNLFRVTSIILRDKFGNALLSAKF